jgi:Zn-dependent metalloprotease
MKTRSLSTLFLFCILNQCIYCQIDQGERTILDSKQATKINILSKNAQVKRYRFRLENRTVRKLDLNIPVSALYSKIDNIEEFNNKFIVDNEDLLRIKNPEENLKLIKKGSGLSEYYLYRQEYKGYPIFGSWLKLKYLSKSNTQDNVGNFVPLFTGVEGRYLADMNFNIPSISIDTTAAVEIVKQYLKVTDPNRFRLFIPPKLWIFNEDLLNKLDTLSNSKNKIAWMIACSSADKYRGGRVDFFIDAKSGKILFIQTRAISTTDIDIEDANNSESSSCWYGSTAEEAWFDEDGKCKFDLFHCTGNICADGWNCANPDQEGSNAFDYTNNILGFFLNVLNMESYDGDNEEVESYVHVGTNWRNANSVDCGCFSIQQFGDQMISLDVYAHEIGHSFHKSQVDFVYGGQSGAIAEHFGDAMGIFISHWSGVDLDWTIGEDCITGTIRDVQNPPQGRDQFSEYLNDPIDEAHDWGGVHTNANILNKAFYLINNGGQFNGYTINGIGSSKTIGIYNVLVRCLPSNPSFEDFRDEVLEICQWMTSDFLGLHFLTNSDYCNIRNALAAIGLADGDSDCDGNLDSTVNDDDNDGIPDNLDNCPHMYSVSTNDMDGDGMGDICDDDIDGDGIINNKDNCPYFPNYSQADRDNDGIGDLCDNCVNTYNSNQKDTDNDGIGDLCDDDIDGDGYPNNNDKCPNYPGHKKGDLCDLGNGCFACRMPFELPQIFDLYKYFKYSDLFKPIIIFPPINPPGPGPKRTLGSYSINSITINATVKSDKLAENFKYPTNKSIEKDIMANVSSTNKYDKETIEEVKDKKIMPSQTLKQPISLTFALMDSEGNLLANRQENIFNNLQSFKITLSYTKFLGKKNQVAANPEYQQSSPIYLIIIPKTHEKITYEELKYLKIDVKLTNIQQKNLPSRKVKSKTNFMIINNK